jgi:class 3 adenylate cyclase/putative methionine-R-sulfoxide reductase with GAF domain
MEELFYVIMKETNQIINSERSTVFLYDENRKKLYSMVATGMGKRVIHIPPDSGIAGWVFSNRKHLLSNDVQNDPRFFRRIDKKTGFQTRNIVCVPLINKEGKSIGAIQALNKIGDEFSDGDVKCLKSIANYVSIAMENAVLYQSVLEKSAELKSALTQIERLELIKCKLTRFVPSSIKSLLETDPGVLDTEKKPMKATILFLDIQGFSHISESYDPNLVNDMIETYFSAYLQHIHKHGGEINETSGDGLMIIFKNGTAKKNSRAAVMTAVEIVRETERLNLEKRYPWEDIKLHIGINTGEVWIGCTRIKSIAGERYTYTASGMATILASRIGALSSDNQIFVGPETYNGVCRCCDAFFIGQKQVKNVKKPVPIYWIKNAAIPNLSTEPLDAGNQK